MWALFSGQRVYSTFFYRDDVVQRRSTEPVVYAGTFKHFVGTGQMAK